MKQYLITLIVAVSATIHAQDAGLESQLQGYWQPDVVKTVALAKKADREVDPLSQAMMGKLVFEFQKDKGRGQKKFAICLRCVKLLEWKSS